MSLLTWYVNRRIRKGDWMNYLPYLLKLQFVQSHRRVIALAALGIVGVIEFLTSPDFLNACAGSTDAFCAWATTAQHTLSAIGLYAGAVGTIFKNDPAPPARPAS